jgi:hypothetical protein
MSGIGANDLVDRIASLASSTGFFDRVNTHEPKNKPGRGLTCAVWIDRIEPGRGRSGLTATTARVVFNVRIYTNMLQNPQDSIDPNMMDAADALFLVYSNGFELGSPERFIDLLGITQGHELFCQSGYINIDNMVFRVLTFTVPVIVNDAWPQAE